MKSSGLTPSTTTATTTNKKPFGDLFKDLFKTPESPNNPNVKGMAIGTGISLIGNKLDKQPEFDPAVQDQMKNQVFAQNASRTVEDAAMQLGPKGMIVGGALKAGRLTGNAIKKQDEFGVSQSQFADTLGDSLNLTGILTQAVTDPKQALNDNPIGAVLNQDFVKNSAIGKELQKTPVGHLMGGTTYQKRKAKRDSIMLDRARQASDENARIGRNYYKSPVANSYEKGGKMSCGCNKEGDGIDTDIFKTMPQSVLNSLYEIVGIKSNTPYTDNEKNKIKDAAKKKNQRLVDFVESVPQIKIYLSTASMRRGGFLKLKIKK